MPKERCSDENVSATCDKLTVKMPKFKINRNENYVSRNIIPRKAKDKALLISGKDGKKEVIQAKRIYAHSKYVKWFRIV